MSEATSGRICSVNVLTLDLRVINVALNNMNEMVAPGNFKVISNEGMVKNQFGRGSLFIRCNILLPDPLNLQQKLLIQRLLQN